MFTKRTLAIIGIHLSVFTNSLMFTVVFPIASKMVMHYGLVENRSETGYWVGILGGSIMVGRFISSPFWGILCDRWGRRPTMLLGIVTTSVLAILFGTATSFFWAVLFRFLQGLLSPISIVTRTLLGELYPAKEQTSSMSCFIIIGSLGNISGNFMGGFFQDPKGLGIPFLDQFPFLLPNLCLAGFGLLSFILCVFFLPETKHADGLLSRTPPRKFSQILCDPLVIQVLMLYGACSSNGTSFGELQVLLMWAKKENGGFEFSPEQIGAISATTSFIFMCYIRTLYKFLVDKIGLIFTTQTVLKYSIFVLLLMPAISYSRYYDILRHFCLIFFPMIFLSFEFICITSTLIMINNSVVTSERGKINGISTALGNLIRGISPPVFGYTFAATANRGWSYPFNFAFSYILLAGVVTIAWVFSKRIQFGLSHPREELLETREEVKKVEENVEAEMISMSVIEETQTS
jgi:MFS family permease